MIIATSMKNLVIDLSDFMIKPISEDPIKMYLTSSYIYSTIARDNMTKSRLF
jgi:hypothetical protein